MVPLTQIRYVPTVLKGMGHILDGMSNLSNVVSVLPGTYI